MSSNLILSTNGGDVGSNPAGVTIWLHPLNGLGGRPLKPIMWVRIPLESPFVMTYFISAINAVSIAKRAEILKCIL